MCRHTVLLFVISTYLWGQICKPWRQVACERLYTPQGVELVIQMDMDSKRPNDRGRYLSKSAEQSSEPGCGLKTVTLLLLYLFLNLLHPSRPQTTLHRSHHMQCSCWQFVVRSHPRCRKAPLAVQWGYGRGSQREWRCCPWWHSLMAWHWNGLGHQGSLSHMSGSFLWLGDFSPGFHSLFKIEDFLPRAAFTSRLAWHPFMGMTLLWPYWLRLQHIVHWAGCPRTPWYLNMLHFAPVGDQAGV